MQYQYIRLVHSHDVVTIVMSRPERHNAFVPGMLDEIMQAAKAAASSARALVLTGDGTFFSIGTETQASAEDYPGLPENLGEVLEGVANPLIACLVDLPIPLVCAINGPAVGAAVGLALVGDLAVMGRRAYLQLAQVAVGLVPDTGATWAIARSLGRSRAMRMALVGERLGADEALACGLVGYVMPDGLVLNEALSLARRLAGGPTLAIGAIRRQVNFAMDHRLEDILALESENQSACGRSADFARGMRALTGKMQPRFAGR